MSKIKVYMGIPSMGDRNDHQTYMLREIEKRYEDEVELVYPEQCVHRFGHDFARNEITQQFLDSDCDILWFLDSDVTPPNHILDLVTIHGHKWEAAGAPYPLWLVPAGQEHLAVQFTAYNGNAPTPDGKAMGLKLSDVPKSGIEFIDGLATGCLFLKRDLFKKLEKPYFAFKRNPETMEVIEGEDLGFALKLQKLGIKFFCDHSMVCGHYKRVNLLDVNNFAAIVANKSVDIYDRQIRDSVQAACAAAYRKGQEDALRSVGAPLAPKRTQSGLILPT